MDWLNDKKNQPIIIGAFVLILAVAGFIVWKTNFAGNGSSADTSASAPTATSSVAPTPSTPAGAPAGTAPTPTASAPAPTSGRTDPFAPVGSKPGAAAKRPGARPAANMMMASMPMESWRNDPFLPVGYKPPVHQPKPVPHLDDLPIPDIQRWTPPTPTDKQVVYAPQPMRRMAGLLLSGRVYAILDTNGRTEVVQPGDRLNDGTATVDRIEQDKVILKTRDSVPRYITVRMARASTLNTSAGATTTPVGGPGGGAYPPRGPMGGANMPPRGP